MACSIKEKKKKLRYSGFGKVNLFIISQQPFHIVKKF